MSRSQDQAQDSIYSYCPNGLPDQITDLQGTTRTVFRGTARTLTVAGTPYVYDASGPVIARGAATFTYGPDGRQAQAQLSGRTVTYRYDTGGNRLIKLEGGAAVAGFVGGGYLTDTGFIDPVRLGGRLVGTQMTSKTIWKGDKGMRIDVENPNPGQRAGQIHFQQGDAKYLYEPVSKSFAGAPRSVNDLLENANIQNAIAKGLRFLGE